MKLQDWIDRRGMSQAEFAKFAGLTQSISSKLCREKEAKGRTWAKVMRATDGEVRPEDHHPVENSLTRKRLRARLKKRQERLSAGAE